MSVEVRLETCEICGQEGFIGEAEVKTHMLLDHEENDGSCPLCDLAHVSVEELALHMNTAHQNILSPVPAKASHSAINVETNRATSSKVPCSRNDVILVADEVHEEDSLIYIEDYFAEPPQSSGQNGFNISHESGSINTSDSLVDNADMAVENGDDFVRNGDVNGVENMDADHSVQLFDVTGNSDDLFADPQPSLDCNSNRKKNAEGSNSSHINVSTEIMVDRTVTKLIAGTTRSKEVEGKLSTPNDKENGRKRGRTEPDVRPKDIQKSCPLEEHDSQESLETSVSSKAESVQSETSSPFRKLFRALKGSLGEAEEDKKEKSGLWVDLTKDSEPDLLDEEAYMIIEDALPADEADWEDMPSTSKGPQSTSTPSRHKDNLSSTAPSSKSGKDKATLLSLSKSSMNVQQPILCPFCGLGNYDTDFIQRHINNEHLEGAVGGSNGTNSASNGVDNSVVFSSDTICTCPICGCVGKNLEEMNVHVEGHFTNGAGGGRIGRDSDREAGPSTSHDRTDVERDRQLAEQLAQDERQAQKKKEEEEFKKLQAIHGADGKGNYTAQSESNSSRAVYRGQMTPAEYHQQRLDMRESLATGVDLGQTRTKGVIPRLIDYYSKGVHNVSFARFSLNLDHFSASRGDVGWGCGYRNIQMLLSAMVQDPKFKQVVFNGKMDIPSIPRLQLLIEDAWSRGFDLQGRDQLSGKVHNTRKWIGATEVVAMFSALRIKCKLYDFHAPTGPNGTHPRLFAWVKDYFGAPLLFDSSARSNKLPLYLQHEGHSRTIVGYDMLKDKSVRLLLFDPSMKTSEVNSLRNGEINGQALKSVRKTGNQMKARQYQIVCVDGLMTGDREFERSKLVTSQRIS